MRVQQPVPQADGIDNTMALMKEGFHFIPRRREELQSDIFETRIMGQKTVCMGGEEAAEVFYDNERFKRKGAAPLPLKSALLGHGAVHGLDGEEHKQRKRMFLSMMTPERIEDMKEIAVEELDKKVSEWEGKNRVVLLDEMLELMARTGMRWAGVPFEEDEINRRTQELTEMVDSFGSAKRLHRGSKARDSHEKWLKDLIKNIRKGKVNAPAYTPAYIVAHHREPNGKLLDPDVAAVELSNAFRPLMATAYFIVFGVVALHEHPETNDKLKRDENNYSQMFTQEVRRYYPFAPAMAAKVKKNFTWQNYKFKKNMLVVLDLFGTNRHPDAWENPGEFRPERFKNWKGSPFAFVPQGGGDHHTGHRCAGEWTTVMVMRSYFKYLTENVSFSVPDQDLSYDLTRMPTMPKSGVVISDVKKKRESADNIAQEEASQTVIKS
ncbi:cytochrome P450 [Salsuginibacillus kocurii]|uniref:cytochrome P450 n=1 Tax=Salsuginibacillus kocurii TaxID=427078 RepID=UPI0003617010|nr:cytochrome P450 [Salsuginibacillus kocurii]